MYGHVGGKEVVFRFESFVIRFHHVQGSAADFNRHGNSEVAESEREKFHEPAERHVLDHLFFGDIVVADIAQES